MHFRSNWIKLSKTMLCFLTFPSTTIQTNLTLNQQIHAQNFTLCFNLTIIYRHEIQKIYCEKLSATLYMCTLCKLRILALTGKSEVWTIQRIEWNFERNNWSDAKTYTFIHVCFTCAKYHNSPICTWRTKANIYRRPIGPFLTYKKSDCFKYLFTSCNLNTNLLNY